ncbi:plasmid mobilization protein [Dyadobacter arcticus]|uniref:Plasmid mobilization relaxosome protein MobC n=1 Tax=Dyadobacter arcticus TaxID=1078754 RepID=A0ABX0UT82_9BACT|nr:plasmid mobilization relaxosome protein MobC [Dyadobacter arcticus]NIJ56177.1 hypothetical protein [Dyadobacter arcticus]
MKKRKSNRTRLVGVRLTLDEYARLEDKCSKTTCRALSEFVRHLIFNRPVTVIERNDSFDKAVLELTRLRKGLTEIGNNFNQSVKRLHTFNQVLELRDWIANYESERMLLFAVLYEIKRQTDKIADQYLQ